MLEELVFNIIEEEFSRMNVAVYPKIQSNSEGYVNKVTLLCKDHWSYVKINQYKQDLANKLQASKYNIDIQYVLQINEKEEKSMQELVDAGVKVI